MHCPVCEEDIPADEFMLHAMIQHPQFFVVWATFSMPTLAPNYQLLVNTIEEDYDEFDNMNYEELLELCNTIGYHKVGIENVDSVAPICSESDVQHDWQCPICLEYKNETPEVRKLVSCGHRFCSCCIERWFAENKCCPVCKKYALPSLEDVD